MEAYHIFGQDLVLSATGDILLVDGVQETNQRIMRRLFTNPGDYLWDLLYGAGLPAKVGLKANAAAIAAVVRSQIFQETTVSQTPPPTIGVLASPSGVVTCTVTYTYAPTGQVSSLTFPIGG